MALKAEFLYLSIFDNNFPLFEPLFEHDSKPLIDQAESE